MTKREEKLVRGWLIGWSDELRSREKNRDPVTGDDLADDDLADDDLTDDDLADGEM